LNRGELYRVYKGSIRDPKKSRVFCIVSRQVLIDSRFSTVICAPVYSNFTGLSTQVKVGVEQGLKHVCCIACDELMSLPKSKMTHFIGKLDRVKEHELDKALSIATGIL